jgi:hypothetical protein
MNKIIVIKESPFQSLLADTYTFLALGIMIYLSKGDTLWTVFTMALFLIMVLTKAISKKGVVNQFSSTENAQHWKGGVKK